MSERESIREGGSGKLPELLKSDDVTGKYKESTIVLKEKLPDKYQQAFNNAWHAVRMNKFKQFKTSVGNLIKFSSGTPAESAPLDVHCKKAMITFGDPEKKEEHLMCLLAWCGFHGRLEFAHHLIHKGAHIDSGNQEVGSPLLQMMVLHDARPGATPLSLEVMHFFTEDNCSVLSRVISTKDNTFTNATALTIALHMKRVDIAQYLYAEHKLHPVLCGSRHYPPLFVEYIEYGMFQFIPWLLTEGFECRAEIVQLINEVSRPEVMEAGLMEGGEVKPGSLMEAASRNDRHVAHAMLLSTNRQAVNMFNKKRPDLVNAVDGRGRTALYIAAEEGVQKPVNILSNMSEILLNMKDKSGVQPVMAAAKAGHINAVERLLFHTLKGDTLAKKPEVVDQIKHSAVTALTYGYHTYFEGFHCESVSAYELNALTLKLDDAGNTAAHMAALKGREDMFKAILPINTSKMITLLTVKNHDSKTPLQLAVEKGHSGMFEVLPTKHTEFLRAWKCFNDALLLYACYHGNVETVNAIMNLNSTAHIQSPKGRTPLSCASEAGNDEVVGYLLTCRHASSDGTVRRPSPEGSGVSKWSPLLLAAAYGHAKVCRRLLEKRASVNIPRCPRTNFTPLMMAIDSGYRDVVITILSDETQGSEAMRVCVAKNGAVCKEGEEVEVTTPMRMLIEVMPDVAEWMMDRSIRTVDSEEEGGEELTEDSCEIEYSFQFLEDFQDETPMLPFSNFFKRSDILPSRRGMFSTSRDPLTLDLDNNGSNRRTSDVDVGTNKKQQEAESEILTTPCTADLAGIQFFEPTPSNMDNIFDTPPPCPSLDEVAEAETLVRLHSHHENDWGPAQYNRHHHPLHIMVSHKRTELLKHPLVVRLLSYKWRKVALPLFVAYITVYLIFLLMLTLFAMLSPRPSPQSRTCILTSRSADVIALKINGTCNAIDGATVDYLYFSSVFIIFISCLYLSVEVVQIFRRRKNYITEGENYIQVLTFVFSIIFVSGYGNECWCAPSWQWQCGAFSLFLAWFNLIILLKDLPFTGIPINMLFNICITFVGLVFLPVLLILSFSLPFYMLFVRDLNAIEGENAQGILNAFESPARAMAKTIMQTTGELDFSDIFNSGDLLYSPTTYILFIMFVVIMPILFSNLLVGLAVGDTAEEKDKAAFTRTRLQVEFILELEAMSAFLRAHMRPSNNRRRYGKRDTRLRHLYRKFMGLDYNDQLEIVKDLRDRDDDFVDAALKEKGPTHELEVKVGGLSVKTVKVEEDVRAVREEMVGVEGRLGERLLTVEKNVSAIKSLLEHLVKSKTEHAEE